MCWRLFEGRRLTFLVKSWNRIIQIISRCYWCFFNLLSLLGRYTVAEVHVVMCFFPLKCSVLMICLVRLQFCTQCMWQEHEMATCTWNLHNFEVQKTWSDTVSRRPNWGLQGALEAKPLVGNYKLSHSTACIHKLKGMVCWYYVFLHFFPGVLYDSAYA